MSIKTEQDADITDRRDGDVLAENDFWTEFQEVLFIVGDWPLVQGLAIQP